MDGFRECPESDGESVSIGAAFVVLSRHINKVHHKIFRLPLYTFTNDAELKELVHTLNVVKDFRP